MARKKTFANPYRPGAGHMPTYLAGREHERNEFRRLLAQETVLENCLLTGLRGVGKTVLLETLKPIAIEERWLWVGTDLSEAASVSENTIVLRMLADLALVTSGTVVGRREVRRIGFLPSEKVDVRLDFATLNAVFQSVPGLVSDKLKAVLNLVGEALQQEGRGAGVIFAYDEAQNLSDHAEKEQYPLALVLEVFQSIQRQGRPFLLLLAGLPTLLPKLIDSRTYSERMFHVLTLDRLNEEDSRAAILKPVQETRCPVKFTETAIRDIIAASGGYPYFIQFICRELFDAYLQTDGRGIPISEAIRKLDSDFFMGRWSRATDRQRQLLWVVAHLEHCDGEFTVQEVAAKSKKVLSRGFSPSHVSQMFATLGEAGLIFKNRHGKYSFAVPLMGNFIRRQAEMQPDWAS